MFAYVLCSIFILMPCPSLTTNVSPANERIVQFFRTSSLNNGHRLPDIQSKDKRDIWSVLNPYGYNYTMDNDEADLEEVKSALGAQIPKITVWQFPTERRAFINDIEIFINSNEGDENSDETLDTQYKYIKHPHKTDFHKLDKDVIDEKQYPAFRSPKSKRENSEKENDNQELINGIKERFNNGNNEGVIRLPDIEEVQNDNKDQWSPL